MADMIGTVQIFGDPAQRLFRNQSPGDTISLRVKGTIQMMYVPNRFVGGFSMPMSNNGTPSIIIEIEGVDP